MGWRLAVAVMLPVMWWRIRMIPWCWEALASWDRRAAGHAVACGDPVAAGDHLQRACDRLTRAIAAHVGSAGHRRQRDVA